MSLEMIVIDGSYGEGGGQILRTSLALAAITGRPVRIVNIRAKRKNPGLAPQHLTAVEALSQITGARVEGTRIRSTELTFIPGPVRPGRYLFDVARDRPSAGSVTLILQAVALPLALSGGESELVLRGGTHVPWSPPAHYIQKVFIPLASRFGLDAEMEVVRWGFYPRGGGEVRVRIRPMSPKPAKLTVRGKLISVTGISACANLPISIAQRQLLAAERKLKKVISPKIEVVKAPSPGPGTALMLWAEFEGSVAGFSSLGEKGKPAEAVGEEAAQELLDFLQTGAAVDHHMADQLIPIMALAKGGSAITTSRITQHLLTNIWVTEKFLDVKFEVKGKLGSPGEVRVIA